MYAIIDVETGGFSKEKNGLCEIGAIILDQQFKVLKQFTSLVKPYTRPNSIEMVSYKEDAMKVHGITMEELNAAPEPVEVAEELEALLELEDVTTIVAHNVNMDKSWVEYFFERFGTGFKFKESICTLQKARDLKLDVENNQLATLLDHFKIRYDQKDMHRAIWDCISTKELWFKLLKAESLDKV